MNLRTVKLALMFCAGPVAAFSQTAHFVINGKVPHKYDNKLIRLYYEDGEIKKTDSTTIKNGSFNLEGTINAPTAGKLSLGTTETGDRTDLFLSEGTLRVLSKDSIHYASISGTRLAEVHEQLAKELRPVDDRMFDMLSFFKEMPPGDEKKAFTTKLIAGIEQYGTKRREIIHRFVTENPASYVSLYYLNKSAPQGSVNYETTYPYFAKLSPELKATPLGKQFEARLLAVKGKFTGKPFINFVSVTPRGDSLSLKEVVGKNKYTLLDFWASWCGPCRKENPNVVKTFNAFKDKGFTVLSVSLDDNADKWKQAIEKDGMPWHHVSALKGWKEPAAVLYGIQAIPQNLLIDQKGKIVAMNLRGETLYSKVQELLK